MKKRPDTMNPNSAEERAYTEQQLSLLAKQFVIKGLKVSSVYVSQ